jgi:hypothetical protein
MSTSCYYPERGDDLAAIRAEDQRAAMNPNCATTGCSAGVHLVCCEAAEPEPATYELIGYSQGVPHLGFSRVGEDGRCSSLTIGRIGGDRSGFPIELPERWGIEQTSDGRCNGMMGSPARDLIGALGIVSQSPPGYCSYTVDITLFFLSDNGEVDPVRFQASGLSPQSYTPEDRCPP